MRKHAITGLSAALLLASGGCGHEFEPPDRGERVREASARYSPSLFDSVTWTSQEVRYAQGNEVYIDKCRNCHGPLGRGQTSYALERGLEVPSLVAPDWPLASLDSLHRVVYVGHEEGMPIYGSGGITPRQIDAVAAYVLEVLRPDAQGTGPGSGL
jgi:mono/diheme cytochrome c family protein